MQWVWIVAVLIVLAVAAQAFFVWHSISKAVAISEPLIKNTKAYEQHPPNSSMRILIAGDSLGVGVGATEPKDSLAGRVGHYFPHASITNIAISGSRLHALEKQLLEHDAEGYDIVLITIGGNDITHGTKFDEIQATLARIVSKADSLGKKVIILTAGNVGLCPAFKWPLSSVIEHRTREVRKIFIEEISKYPNARYVDLFNEREDEPFNKDIPRYYAPDLFHPSGDGYALWFEKLKPLL